MFLTANADTVYFLGIVDLTSGPMVVETPPQALGVFDDMWWRWIIDFGLPGPDRGEGGRFLLVPPGYDGPLPDSGYHVGHSRTSRALLLGRSFLTDDDPAPTVETIKSTLKIYPYAPGGSGTSVATLLEGGVPPAAPARGSRDGVRGGEREGVQHGAAERLRLLRADERGGAGRARRQHEPRADGAAGRDRDRQGRAVRARRADAAHPRGGGRRRQRDLAGAVLRRAGSRKGSRTTTSSAWFNMLWVGGYTFETPPPLVTHEGIKPFPATGVRKLHSRTSFFYAATGVTPAMCMRLTGIGSQYLMAVKDADGEPPRRREDLPGDPAAGHPGGPLLVGHALRQPDALDAPDAAALPARRQPVLPDTGGDRERRRLDDHHVRPGATRRTARRATGSRRRKARAGSRSCASTARSSRSSTRPGGRARSSP